MPCLHCIGPGGHRDSHVRISCMAPWASSLPPEQGEGDSWHMHGSDFDQIWASELIARRDGSQRSAASPPVDSVPVGCSGGSAATWTPQSWPAGTSQDRWTSSRVCQHLGQMGMVRSPHMAPDSITLCCVLGKTWWLLASSPSSREPQQLLPSLLSEPVPYSVTPISPDALATPTLPSITPSNTCILDCSLVVNVSPFID